MNQTSLAKTLLEVSSAPDTWTRDHDGLLHSFIGERQRRRCDDQSPPRTARTLLSLALLCAPEPPAKGTTHALDALLVSVVDVQ